MNQKSIIVDIMPDGSVKIDAVGFKGPDCEKATKFLEDALGVKTENKRKYPDFAQRDQIGAQQKAGQ